MSRSVTVDDEIRIFGVVVDGFNQENTVRLPDMVCESHKITPNSFANEDQGIGLLFALHFRVNVAECCLCSGNTLKIQLAYPARACHSRREHRTPCLDFCVQRRNSSRKAARASSGIVTRIRRESTRKPMTTNSGPKSRLIFAYSLEVPHERDDASGVDSSSGGAGTMMMGGATTGGAGAMIYSWGISGIFFGLCPSKYADLAQ